MQCYLFNHGQRISNVVLENNRRKKFLEVLSYMKIIKKRIYYLCKTNLGWHSFRHGVRLLTKAIKKMPRRERYFCPWKNNLPNPALRHLRHCRILFSVFLWHVCIHNSTKQKCNGKNTIFSLQLQTFPEISKPSIFAGK